MTAAKSVGPRSAALALSVTGVLTLLLSLGTWGACPTTPCGGPLQALSWYSGLDLGFGVVTALAGLVLAAIGLGGLRDMAMSRFATAAALLALLIAATASATVIWMYVLPGADKEYHWPPYTVILVGILGLIALAASVRLGRTVDEDDEAEPEHEAPRDR